MKANKQIELQNWWLSVLRRVTQNVMEEEEKRQERIKKTNLKKMGEYRTEADIMDAYGCGVITAAKKDKLLDLLEELDRAAENDELYTMKLELLSEFGQIAKNVIRDQEIADRMVAESQGARA